MDAASKELQALTSALGTMAAGGTLTVVRALLRGGANPNQALRLASVAQVATEFGWQTISDLGVPERTEMNWRRELKKFLEASGGAEAVIDDSPTLIRSMLNSAVWARDVAAAAPDAEGEGERGGPAASGASGPRRSRSASTPRPVAKN